MHHNNRKVRALLGLRVKALRKAANLTQDLLAERCGIFRTYLSRIENGTANPSLQVLATLAEALHVSIHDLLVADNGHRGGLSNQHLPDQPAS